jgi:hypothetical protein
MISSLPSGVTTGRGQEIDKRPTAEYLKAMKLAIDAVAAKEGKS